MKNNNLVIFVAGYVCGTLGFYIHMKRTIKKLRSENEESKKTIEDLDERLNNAKSTLSKALEAKYSTSSNDIPEDVVITDEPEVIMIDEEDMIDDSYSVVTYTYYDDGFLTDETGALINGIGKYATSEIRNILEEKQDSIYFVVPDDELYVEVLWSLKLYKDLTTPHLIDFDDEEELYEE